MSQTVTRALRLLAELGEGERSLDQLAELIGVHKTTVLRLLQTLEEERFVHRDAAYRYHLGAGLFALSSLALEQRGIRRIAAPHLAELNAATGHTVHLAAYEGGEVVYIDKYDSRHPVRMYSRIGLRAGLHCTAVAKVLLADLPPAGRRRVAGAIEYTPHTANTLAGPRELLAELETVAARGWAQDRAEHESFINCVAAPVRDAGGRVAAAVSISVPDVVLPYEQVLELVPRLLACARAASADAGAPPHDHPSAPPATAGHRGGTMSEKTEIRTDGAPAPAWLFSQGVRRGPILQVSGQGPQDPATGAYLYPGDVKAQTRRTLENVRAIVEAGGGTVADVVMFRVYLTERAHFPAMNEAYAEFLAQHLAPEEVKPCRTTVFVGLPQESMLVEIDAQAVVTG
ncbi:IclR family transcriptional regulator domain-containing protein [Kitasatospora camelliae]|uniref:IclR family transcriptional regulator C-terminal domain-containing protein n=1 Tax=Kitasatospora camelliae TaxID=3156397 RepID=A0AAU8K4L4_9ACTN